MGNQASIFKPIDDFIFNLSDKKLTSEKLEEKKDVIKDLMIAFQTNPKFYKEFYEFQSQSNIQNENENQNQNDIATDNKNDNTVKIPARCTDFISILCNIGEFEFSSDLIEVMINIVKIMKIMVYEPEFFRIFKTKVLDKFIKKLEDKDINFNEKKIELVLNYYELFNETVIFIGQNKKDLKSNLQVLDKIYNIPKRNTDKIKNKTMDFKYLKYKILSGLFEIFKDISESKDEKHNTKTLSDNEERMKNYLYDYNLNNVYRDMLYDLENKQAYNNQQVYELIITCFTHLSYIDYVIMNKYLTEEHIDKLIKFITLDTISASNSDLVINSLKFLINFYIKSLDMNIQENFKIFADEKNDVIKSIFSILSNYADPKIINSEENTRISFLISCFFITLSIKSSVWEKINEKKIIKPCCDFIKKFIYDTFSQKYFPSKIVPADINDEKEKNKELVNEELRKTAISRFALIKLLAKILGFISKDNIFKKIYHIEFFKYIFNFVIDLFHVDYTDINLDIYSIFNVCTYFNECKIYFYIEKERTFQILRNDLFNRIKTSLQNYNYLKDSIKKNEEAKKFSNEKQEDIENDDIKSTLKDKLKLFDTINNKSRIFAAANFKDFTLLMSILSNLLIMNDFTVFKKFLFSDANIEIEAFKKDLCLFIEDFDKRGNLKNRVVTYDKFIHPAKIFLMIFDPMIKFNDGKRVEYDDTNEKARYLEIIKEYKVILDATANDDDIQHKILFVIYRFLSKCKSHRDIFDIIDSILMCADKTIYKISSGIIVNREWLRLMHSLLQFADNTLFWLKFDSNKVFIDSANNCDVVIKYKDERDLMGKKLNLHTHNLTAGGKNLQEKIQEKGTDNKDDIINLPFHKVKTFNEMGVIMFSTHHLLIPKVLQMGKSYTIFFRFYYPIINSDNEHVLLQDCSGSTLLAITRDRKNIVAYATNGDMIDSGIILDQRYQNMWLSAGLSYSEADNYRKIQFFFENEPKISFDKGENSRLTDNIAYIGNSKDFSCPFGAFCDLRVYSGAADINGYLNIKRLNEEERSNIRSGDSTFYAVLTKINNSIMPKILENFLSPYAIGNPLKCNDFDNTEESFYFFIKVLNALLINKENRNAYINYELIFKIMEFLSSKSSEIKKDIAKFLNTIS